MEKEEARVAIRNSKGMLVWAPVSKLKNMQKEERPEEEWTPAMKKAKEIMLSRILSEKE